MKFPSIQNVAHDLRVSAKNIDWCRCRTSEECEFCDVRLQVYPDGAWVVRVGPSDYDPDHRGFWGASSVSRGRFNAADTARELIEQCRDHAAQSMQGHECEHSDCLCTESAE